MTARVVDDQLSSRASTFGVNSPSGSVATRVVTSTCPVANSRIPFRVLICLFRSFILGIKAIRSRVSSATTAEFSAEAIFRSNSLNSTFSDLSSFWLTPSAKIADFLIASAR